MNLFKSRLTLGLSSPVTRRLAQFCLLALPLSTMATFVSQPSFAEPNPNACGDGAGDCVKYDLRTQAVCTQVGTQTSPNPAAGTAPGWYQGLNTELDNKNLKGDVVAYQIKWSNNVWSSWYVTGVNDIDIKYNLTNKTMRRMWSYFTDHPHLYIICKEP
jgi:hypothetical protein